LTPFVAAATRTQTAFLDLDDAAGRTHATYGAALTVRGPGLFGVEFETALTPSAFTGNQLVISSHVVTALGSVVVAVPARWSRHVRPYAALGGGGVRIHSMDVANIFPVDDTVFSLAAGVWVPVRHRIAVRAAVRYLRSGSDGLVARFETWQTSAGLAFSWR
jgi:opacity protein-like surface antigen